MVEAWLAFDWFCLAAEKRKAFIAKWGVDEECREDLQEEALEEESSDGEDESGEEEEEDSNGKEAPAASSSSQTAPGPPTKCRRT
jgi:hypothetical protein